MPLTVTNNVEIKLSSIIKDTVGLATAQGTISQAITNQLTTTTTNLVYSITGTMVGTDDTYDLAGALETPLGEAAVFAKVMCVFIRNNGVAAMHVGGTNTIPILSGATNTIELAPNAYLLYVDQTGITITDTAADIIKITGTADDTYDIIVIGASA